MRIFFVRHGDPDYKNDCLTPLGHLQAEALAQRLKDENIELISSSTNGRAYETAEHTAKLLGLGIKAYDFIREIKWGSRDGEPLLENGHPWKTARLMTGEGESLLRPDYAERPPFDRNIVTDFAKKVAEGVDEWLESLGYKRDGEFYRVIRPDSRNIVMFCHGGSSSAVLSHVFNLPLPFVFATITTGHAGIFFEIILEGQEGARITPKLGVTNDTRHTRGIVLDREFEF